VTVQVWQTEIRSRLIDGKHEEIISVVE